VTIRRSEEKKVAILTRRRGIEIYCTRFAGIAGVFKKLSGPTVGGEDPLAHPVFASVEYSGCHASKVAVGESDGGVAGGVVGVVAADGADV
jgi:hypothetical protein